jgi:hypothetical protein
LFADGPRIEARERNSSGLLGELSEQAIAASISVQPHVKSITVSIDRKMIEDSLSSFGYTELKGPMLKVDAVIKYDRYEAHVGIQYKDGYPLMLIKDIREV